MKFPIIALLIAIASKQSACFDKEKDCRLPPESGNCQQSYSLYYYDSTDISCKPMTYTGCGGNQNRFRFKLDCLTSCSGIISDSPNPTLFKEDSSPSYLEETLKNSRTLTDDSSIQTNKLNKRYGISDVYPYAQLQYVCGNYISHHQGVESLDLCVQKCDNLQLSGQVECTGLVFTQSLNRCELRKDCDHNIVGAVVPWFHKSWIKLKFPLNKKTLDGLNNNSPIKTTESTTTTTTTLKPQQLVDPNVMREFYRVNGFCPSKKLIVVVENIDDYKICAAKCVEFTRDQICVGFEFLQHKRSCELFSRCLSRLVPGPSTWIRMNV